MWWGEGVGLGDPKHPLEIVCFTPEALSESLGYLNLKVSFPMKSTAWLQKENSLRILMMTLHYRILMMMMCLALLLWPFMFTSVSWT